MTSESSGMSSLLNDSQVTLVNGDGNVKTELVFAAWDRILSTAVLKDGKPLYKIATIRMQGAANGLKRLAAPVFLSPGGRLRLEVGGVRRSNVG